MWFEKLTGFREENPKQVRSNIDVVENKLISKINGAELCFGKLTIPSLDDLRTKSNLNSLTKETIQLTEVIGDI